MTAYRRKSTPEVEAFYYTGTEPAPTWVSFSTEEYDGWIKVKTASGVVDVKLPTWLIQEQSGKGCYPVSVEYFENNFEIVEK